MISDESCVCRLCLEIIEEPNYTNEGQDVARSIFCDGDCNGWLHRRCAGLSLTGFAAAVESSSDEDFFCTRCQLKKQDKEINDLQATVLSLTIKMNELQQNTPSSVQVSNPLGTTVNLQAPVPTPSQSTRKSLSKPPAPKNGVSMRKFNVVIRGIKESPKGTHWRERAASDDNSAFTILSKIVPSLNILKLSLRDSRRLGRYSDNTLFQTSASHSE